MHTFARARRRAASLSRYEKIYGYASADPFSLVDPSGLASIPDPNGVVPGGPWTPNPKARAGNFLGPKASSGGRAQCQWVPEEGEGGPPGSKGYWKANMPGQKGWDRYDRGTGDPISPDEAHPGNVPDVSPSPVPPSYLPSAVRFGVGLGLLLYSSPAY